jgi:cytochrome c oxidase subunit 4
VKASLRAVSDRREENEFVGKLWKGEHMQTDHSVAGHADSAHEEGQQHPIKLYLVVWGWLFVLSTFSYLVDFFGIQGMWRWSLIIIFMLLKAGLIVAIFMHMAWERLALIYAILTPPGAVLFFVATMAVESTYTLDDRMIHFGPTPPAEVTIDTHH